MSVCRSGSSVAVSAPALFIHKKPHSSCALMQIERGSWFRSKSPGDRRHRRPVCKEYTARPGENGVYLSTLQANTYFGPAHQAKPGMLHGDAVISVQVPSQIDPTLLVWINVTRAQVTFAKQVPANELARWIRNGWQQHFRANGAANGANGAVNGANGADPAC